MGLNFETIFFIGYKAADSPVSRPANICIKNNQEAALSRTYLPPGLFVIK